MFFFRYCPLNGLESGARNVPGFMSGGPPEALEHVVRFVKTLEGFMWAEDVIPGVKALWFETEEEARTAQWLLELNGVHGSDWRREEGST